MWTRRAFLKSSGLSLVSLGCGSLGAAAPAFLARAAQGARRRRVLVTVFQRGAMDGLAAVPLLNEPALRTLRPRLMMSAARTAGQEGLIDLDGRFGLHPALRSLEPLYREGNLAMVHAVGSPATTRSHFDAQDYMETGTPDEKGTESGWLNRVVGELGHEGAPLRAVALTSAMPRSLYGPQPALAVARLADLSLRLPGAQSAAVAASHGFEALYRDTSARLLRERGGEAFDAVALLADRHLSSYRPAAGVRYPAGALGSALEQIAQLIKADVGLEVAFAESAGWDTHVQQGAAQGSFARRAAELGDSLAAFWRDLGEWRGEVVVMTMTEFGRTVRENGSGGTDHGHGSCLFVLGERVEGGKVYGQLESLEPDALFEGRDLPVTTDFRRVFSEVAARHLGVADQAALFPGWQGEPVGLLRRDA